jgi:hypothetical protein
MESAKMTCIKISKAANGFIINREKDPDDDEIAPLPIVVEESEFSSICELVAARQLLWYVCEEFGINVSRKRPHIKILIHDENEQEMAGT